MKLSEVLDENISENTEKIIQSVLSYISQALENSRKIIYDLSPPVLYELGLVEAMQWLAEKTQKEFNLKVSFQTEIKKLILSESKMILIYRIIQELTNNVIKHAGASLMKLSLERSAEHLEIVVADNGEGFILEEKKESRFKNDGFGLFAVKEKVHNLKGEFRIQSKPGKGTTIKIFIPLETLNENTDAD